jgi:hypothetical protein
MDCLKSKPHLLISMDNKFQQHRCYSFSKHLNSAFLCKNNYAVK